MRLGVEASTCASKQSAYRSRRDARQADGNTFSLPVHPSLVSAASGAQRSAGCSSLTNWQEGTGRDGAAGTRVWSRLV